MASRTPKPSTAIKYYPFNGGLDVVTPPLSVDPGFCLAMVNFEPYYNGGYRRVDGYERFDGHAKPSAATAYGVVLSSLSYGTGTGTLPYGTGTTGAYTGNTSGATGQLVDAVTVSGTAWGCLTNVTGTFVVGETITNGTVTSSGTIVTAPSAAYAPSGTSTTGYLYSSDFLANAQAYYRSKISAVPGTGVVQGVWQTGTNVYAVRAPNGTGAAVMYLSSGTGWGTSGLTFCTTIYFGSLGTQGAPAYNAVVTGASSGATGTVYTSVLHTTSAGYIAMVNASGTFTNGELLKTSGTSFATSQSASSQFTLPNSGFYRWRTYNFYASPLDYFTYGVNGAGPAFQIDSSNIIMPILFPLNPLTGQPSANTPFLVESYANCLALALPGGTYELSVPGVPIQFNGFLGALEFGLGSELTGMFSTAGPNLALVTQQNTQVLSGNSSATYVQSMAAERASGLKYGSQLLDTVYSLGNLGITSLSRTQSYGNFVGATVSQLVQPIINTLRPNFTDSTIVRQSNQARFYFSDGSALIMYIPGLGQQNKAWSAMESGVTAQFGYASYPNPVYNIANCADNNQLETSYFSSTNADGFVYQDRSGTSWDGTAVTSYLRLAFNNVGSPAVRKFYRRADIEINAQAQVNLKFAADLSYSNAESSSAVLGLTATNIPTLSVFGGGGYWDTVNWNNFLWDGQSVSTARASLSGTGENISFLIFHQAIVDAPFVLQGLVLHYDSRRLQR